MAGWMGQMTVCQVEHRGPTGLNGQRGHGPMISKQQQQKQYIYLFTQEKGIVGTKMGRQGFLQNLLKSGLLHLFRAFILQSLVFLW